MVKNIRAHPVDYPARITALLFMKMFPYIDNMGKGAVYFWSDRNYCLSADGRASLSCYEKIS